MPHLALCAGLAVAKGSPGLLSKYSPGQVSFPMDAAARLQAGSVQSGAPFSQGTGQQHGGAGIILLLIPGHCCERCWVFALKRQQHNAPPAVS